MLPAMLSGDDCAACAGTAAVGAAGADKPDSCCMMPPDIPFSILTQKTIIGNLIKRIILCFSEKGIGLFICGKFSLNKRKIYYFAENI